MTAGFICLDKPQDMTSFSAVRAAGRILGEKKAGHTGTLDPMATGVLPIALGSCTRFIELLPHSRKAYTARVRLGLTTDTLDITGTVTGEFPVTVSERALLETAAGFTGEITQLPPMYSAIQKDGVRLYELARQGIEIEREARKVTIYDLQLSDFNGTEFTMAVVCSAGTYIRTLADDIGRALGCGAVLTALRRTEANGFALSEAVTLEVLREYAEKGEADALIVPVDKCLSDYAAVTVTPAQAKRFSNGGALSLQRVNCPNEIGYYRVYAPAGEFLGVGEIKADSDELSVKRVYNG